MKDMLKKLKEAGESSKPRKFRQSWDLTINVKGLDLKKPENRFRFDFMLPEGRGKPLKVCVIADSLAAEARKQFGLRNWKWASTWQTNTTGSLERPRSWHR